MKSFKKKSHQKERLKTLLEVQLPCWSQPLAPMGPGKFFSPRGGAAGWEELVFPCKGRLSSQKTRSHFGENFHHQRIESVLVCSGIHGYLSKSPFKGFVSLRQARNQRFACVLCCCYGKLKITINLDWDLPNSTQHFVIPKPTLAIQQWNHPET